MNEEAVNVQTIDWNALLVEPIKHNGEKIIGFLPNIVEAFFILAIGWFIALMAQIVSRSFLGFIAFDSIAEKSGFAAALKENGISTKPTEWLSRLFYWIAMIAAIVKSLFSLRLGQAADGVDLFSGIIFQSGGLLLIFIIGLFLSVVLSRIVHTTAVNLNVKSPAAYGRTMKWTVLVFTILLVLRQIAIPMNFIFLVAGAVFVSICIAFIIAFGVGGAGWAAKTLEKISK